MPQDAASRVVLALRSISGVRKICVRPMAKAELMLPGKRGEQTANFAARRRWYRRLRRSRGQHAEHSRRQTRGSRILPMSRPGRDGRRFCFAEGPARTGRCPCPSPICGRAGRPAAFYLRADGLQPVPSRRRHPDADRPSPATGGRGPLPSRLIRQSAKLSATISRTRSTRNERSIMTIKVGDRLPNATFMTMTADGTETAGPPTTFFKARRSCCSRCPAPLRRPATRTHAGFRAEFDKIKQGHRRGPPSPR